MPPPSCNPAFTYDATFPGQVNFEKRTDIVSKTFSKDVVDFTILDLLDDGSGPRAHRATCHGTNAAALVTNHNPNARVRIFSIPALKTVLPLSITFDLMSQIMVEYKIEANMWDVLYSFGDAPHPAEGSGTNAFAKTYVDGSQTCCYELRYVEENHRKHGKPWSDRHTGIYHRHVPHAYGPGKPLDVFVLLHSNTRTVLEMQLLAMTNPQEVMRSPLKRLFDDPGALHELLLESYLGNWRWYLRYQGDAFTRHNDELFTFEMSEPEPVSLGFEPVRRFRYMKDRFLVAQAFCRENIAVIDFLKSIRTQSGFVTTASALRERVCGYLSGLEVLESRVSNSIALLEYSLDLKNDGTSTEINRHIVELTHSTVDDSAIVRLITLVGLLYLPGTFISGIFGMSFFTFNAESGTIEIAWDFWVYICTWLPATAITMAIYWYMVLQRRRAGRRKSGKSGKSGKSDSPKQMKSVGQLNMERKGIRRIWSLRRRAISNMSETVGV